MLTPSRNSVKQINRDKGKGSEITATPAAKVIESTTKVMMVKAIIEMVIV